MAGVVDPWQLIAYVALGPNRPAETEYNLVSFYTRTGDVTRASGLLLRAVRETERQEREVLLAGALSDPTLIPLLRKRPGLKAKLYEMLDAAAPFPDPAGLSEHFDLQNRAISYYQALGWTVNWSVDMSDVDLTASKGSRVLLIVVPGPDSPGDTADVLFRQVQLFRRQHPEVEDVHGSIVISRFSDYPAGALVTAQEHDLEVLQYVGLSLCVRGTT